MKCMLCRYVFPYFRTMAISPMTVLPHRCTPAIAPLTPLSSLSAGPLHHTTDDFWAMVWEQKCPLVVMLTTLVEQGRVKCHQYWPDEGQTLLFGDFQVTTVSEEVTESFAFREITVQSQEVGTA